MKEPTIFIISGPSGSGKTTLLNELLRYQPIKKNFLRGISFTTRHKRPQEKQGQDYFFISKKNFLGLKRKKFFLESQKVLENYYGTPRYFYSQAKNKNKDLILCIDVKGGMYLKRKQKNIRIVMIFISAPNAGELNRRLKKRVEKIESITERLKLAKKELQFSKYYDYVIVNQSIPLSVNILKNILLKGG